MKYLLFFACLFLGTSVKVAAQTGGFKLYAYVREVSGGAAIEGEDRTENYQYIFYLVTPPNQKPVVSSVYIKGKAYSTKLQKVKVPVVFNIENENGKMVKKTLVSATSSPVYQLVLIPDESILPPTKQLRQLITTNDVTLSGLASKGKFVLSVKKMNALPMLLVQ